MIKQEDKQVQSSILPFSSSGPTEQATLPLYFL
jgi:hypothetical protein